MTAPAELPDPPRDPLGDQELRQLERLAAIVARRAASPPPPSVLLP